MMLHMEHPGTGQAMTIKSCEGCTRNFLIPVPISAKRAEKYCQECKPIFGAPNKRLPDCSHLIDPHHPNATVVSAINEEYGTDLDRRQRKQLAWLNGFAREMDVKERKAREMKVRMGGRYK